MMSDKAAVKDERVYRRNLVPQPAAVMIAFLIPVWFLLTVTGYPSFLERKPILAATVFAA